MKVKTITDLKKVSLKIDLEDIFGVPVKDAALRTEIADELISTIISRTQSGYGVEDDKIVKFVKYTKDYAQKVGKSRLKVDLDLKGDMLNALHEITSEPKELEIGIDDHNAPKAHGHMTGQYGKGPLPRRSFLGLTQKDLNKIKARYQDEVQGNFEKKADEFFNQEQKQAIGLTREDILAALEELNTLGIAGLFK